MEVAIFAAGCFWGVEDIMRKLDGVITTDVGYCGGSASTATYEHVKKGHTGHAEAVRVEFDPAKITYGEILDTFFRLHDPTTENRQGGDVGSQYRSVIFYQNEIQHRVAEDRKVAARESGRWQGEVVTEIVPAQPFYPAEEYHQDYLVKHPHGYTCHYLRD